MVQEGQLEKGTVQEGLQSTAPGDLQMQDITQIETAQEETPFMMGIAQDLILVIGKRPRTVGEDNLI